MKFSEINNTLSSQGYAADFVRIDQILIEQRSCPECRSKLVYQGLSNAVTYLAYGVCEPCDYAKLFWRNSSEFVSAKRHFSKGFSVSGK